MEMLTLKENRHSDKDEFRHGGEVILNQTDRLSQLAVDLENERICLVEKLLSIEDELDAKEQAHIHLRKELVQLKEENFRLREDNRGLTGEKLGAVEMARPCSS